MVGYCRRGTWCLRSYVAHPYDPRTPAQLGQRARFKAMMQFASEARKAIALGLRRQARRLGLVDNNYFLVLNKQWFTAGGVDYRRLQFSEGSIGVRSETWRVESRGEDGVFRMRCGGERGSIYVFAYCPAEGRGYLSMPSEGCVVQFALPEEFVGREVHYYGFRVAPNGVASHTVYIEKDTQESVEKREEQERDLQSDIEWTDAEVGRTDRRTGGPPGNGRSPCKTIKSKNRRYE